MSIRDCSGNPAKLFQETWVVNPNRVRKLPLYANGSLSLAPKAEGMMYGIRTWTAERDGKQCVLRTKMCVAARLRAHNICAS